MLGRPFFLLFLRSQSDALLHVCLCLEPAVMMGLDAWTCTGLGITPVMCGANSCKQDAHPEPGRFSHKSYEGLHLTQIQHGRQRTGSICETHRVESHGQSNVTNPQSHNPGGLHPALLYA